MRKIQSISLWTSGLVLHFLLLSNTEINGFGTWSHDSIQNLKTKCKGDLTIITRLHSTDHFAFTGSYINNHLNSDIYISYERNQIGAFVFQSRDLEDGKSIVNYFQPGVFKRIQAGSTLQFTVFAGYLFSQTSGFSDKDSDGWASLNTTVTISDHFKIENTSIFFNFIKPELRCQLTNRTVFSTLVKDFKFDLFVWHNIIVKTNDQFASAAVAVNFPIITLSEKIKIRNSFTYQFYITPNRPSYATHDGFLFSIAVPIQISSTK